MTAIEKSARAGKTQTLYPPHEHGEFRVEAKVELHPMLTT